MEKRAPLSLIYFVSMLSLIITRILFSVFYMSGDYLTRDQSFTLITQLVCMGALPLSLYFLYLKRNRVANPAKTFLKDFQINKFDRRHLKNILIISFLGTFITACVSMLWQSLLYSLGFNFGSTSSGGATKTYLDFVIEIFFVACLPACFEELTNRGLLRGAFGKSQAAKYIFVSALLFALMHQNITQVVYTFFGGLMMASLAYYTRSIWPAAIYHFINNFVATGRGFTSLAALWPFKILNNLYNFLFGNVLGLLLAVVLFFVCAAAILRCFKKIRKLAYAKVPIKVYDVVIYESRFADFSYYTCEKPYVCDWRDNIYFYATVVLNLAATIFSLVWGLLL